MRASLIITKKDCMPDSEEPILLFIRFRKLERVPKMSRSPFLPSSLASLDRCFLLLLLQPLLQQANLQSHV